MKIITPVGEVDAVVGGPVEWLSQRVGQLQQQLAENRNWPCEGLGKPAMPPEERCKVTLGDLLDFDSDDGKPHPGHGMWVCGECWHATMVLLESARSMASAYMRERDLLRTEVAILRADLARAHLENKRACP